MELIHNRGMSISAAVSEGETGLFRGEEWLMLRLAGNYLKNQTNLWWTIVLNSTIDGKFFHIY